MKQYIKNGIIYNLPIAIQQERIVKQKYVDDNGEEKIKEVKHLFNFYTNDEEKILANGYTKYVYTPPQKPLELLIEESNESINKITDDRILNDFEWDGNEFYLTMENQFNFKNLYDLREMKEYPVTIKTKTGFTTLDDVASVSNFYISGATFIENCLKEGWQKKLDAEQEIRNNYK